METTTIQIRRSLKRRLEVIKAYPNESMDQVIERLVEGKMDHEPLSEADIRDIETGLADIRAGKVYTTQQLKKKLGIK